MSLVAQWLECLLYIWKVGSSILGGDIAMEAKPMYVPFKQETALLQAFWLFFKEFAYSPSSLDEALASTDTGPTGE